MQVHSSLRVGVVVLDVYALCFQAFVIRIVELSVFSLLLSLVSAANVITHSFLLLRLLTQ